MQICILTYFNVIFNYSYEQESKTQFVVDAVYAFAYALHNLHYDLCVKSKEESQQEMYRQRGVCHEMINYDGFEFYKNYLLNVSFIGKYNIYIIGYLVPTLCCMTLLRCEVLSF